MGPLAHLAESVFDPFTVERHGASITAAADLF